MCAFALKGLNLPILHNPPNNHTPKKAICLLRTNPNPAAPFILTMSNVLEGEKHTPAKDLANVGLLIYRNEKKPELLVRYNPSEKPRVYCIPNRLPRPGETAIDTAKRVAGDSLGRDILDDALDYRRSAIIENPAIQ